MIIKLLRVTLIVRDQEEAFRFYTEKLGFEKRADQPMGENTRWLTIAPKEKTYDLLRERGVKFEQSPQKRPYGLEALAKDLYGNTLDLLETHN
jgi:catechol 2,3-dioxygenase-like lactoylglutathione lyase family enzyme